MGEQQLGIALCVPGQGFAAVGPAGGGINDGTMAGYGRAFDSWRDKLEPVHA